MRTTLTTGPSGRLRLRRVLAGRSRPAPTGSSRSPPMRGPAPLTRAPGLTPPLARHTPPQAGVVSPLGCAPDAGSPGAWVATAYLRGATPAPVHHAGTPPPVPARAPARA